MVHHAEAELLTLVAQQSWILHILHHVGYLLKCLTVVIVGEDGVLAQFSGIEVSKQAGAYDVKCQQTVADLAWPMVGDEQCVDEQIEYEDVADAVIVTPYIMTRRHGDENQTNGNRHVFVSFQSQAQQHTAQEDRHDEGNLTVVCQYTSPVLHIRRTVAVLIGHRLVGQHEVVVEEGSEGIGHDEVDDERGGYQHGDKYHPSEG